MSSAGQFFISTEKLILAKTFVKNLAYILVIWAPQRGQNTTVHCEPSEEAVALLTRAEGPGGRGVDGSSLPSPGTSSHAAAATGD